MGGEDSEGWSGESGSSDATLNAELEEAKEEPAPLTASPWGTQESGASGLQVGARSGGSGSGKATSGTTDGGGDTEPPWGRKTARRGKGRLPGLEVC